MQEGSIWNSASHPLKEFKFPWVRESLDLEVAIIGSGIGAFLAALELQRRGKEVVLFHIPNEYPGEEQGLGLLTQMAPYDSLAWIHGVTGKTGTQCLAEAFKTAFSVAAEWGEREKIPWESLSGRFLNGNFDAEGLQKELKALFQTGYRSVDWEYSSPYPGFDAGPSLHYRDQRGVNPFQLWEALKATYLSEGGTLLSLTHRGRVLPAAEGGLYRLTEERTITARHLLLMTPIPHHPTYREIPYIECRMAFEEGAPVEGCFWEEYGIGRPGYRARALSPRLLLIAGGAYDADTPPSYDPFAKLERWARRRFPTLGRKLHQWVGASVSTDDGLPLIGRDPRFGEEGNVLFASGENGWGVRYELLAGLLLTHFVLGRENRFASLFSPSRFRWGSLAYWIGKNFPESV